MGTYGTCPVLSGPAARTGPQVSTYFDSTMLHRQRLLWAVATRQQLERWEPLVASVIRVDPLVPDSVTVWAAAIEHHFALVAARNLFRALDLDPPTQVAIDPTLRAELIEGRDLHEHWPENMPIFNVKPRTAQPQYRSGRDFAARNPDEGPYWWLGWNSKAGARLLPNVYAPGLHALLDAVEAEVLGDRPELAEFVPPRAPSPWIHERDEWWPKPEDGEG
jgi:hypothetical protein